MGYYTRYNIQLREQANPHIVNDGLTHWLFDHIKRNFEFQNDSNFSYLTEIETEQYSGTNVCDWITFGDATKWYDHEKDLKNLSLDFPEHVIVCFGIGEEYDDIWMKYFANGKMQVEKAKIIAGEFDSTKLI